MALTIWDMVTAKSGLLPRPYFPGMPGIFGVMYDDRILLLRSTIYSMRLFFAGVITGAILGLATGILIGWRRQWDYWLSPVIRVTGIIPAAAWLIAGLDRPQSGRILIDGQEIRETSHERGYLFQHPTLFPWAAVFENAETRLRA
ncbi:MAG: hypothetical protein LBP88_06520 [Treponema sp.]|jgi:hypothetical protein|nr:hypothetical protein [Treponema sp.]